MYLVMTKDKPTPFDEFDARRELQAYASDKIYEGQPLKVLETYMKEEHADVLVITADSRLLQFVPHIVPLTDVYIYTRGEPLIRLQEATSRILKPTHNLMKLFDAGEFDKKEGSV